MLLEKIHEEIQAEGLGAGNNFKIATSAKAFEILSSNLYQDKILAVIRELSCNAADAHTSVGLPLSDIKIKLPTFTEPTFVVRDFGPGLSDEDVRHLYTTYFQSTKDGSNEAIGGFGLGSKAPFAIVDQFTVRSFHSGYVRTYVCYKNSGVPAINFISEEPTDETGLEVSLAIPMASLNSSPTNLQSSQAWFTRATNYFQWWPEQPSIHPLDTSITFVGDTKVLSAQHIVSHNRQPLWFISNTLTTPHVWMGLVPYSLNLSSIPNLPAEVTSTFANIGLVLNVPIGAVEISPSRETLSYDPKTCAVITKLLQTILAEISDEIVKQLDACETLYKAREFLFANDNVVNALRTTALLKQLHVAGRLLWKGKPIPRVVTIDTKTQQNTITLHGYSKHLYRSNWRRFNPDTTLTHRFINYDTYFYVWSPTVTAKTYKLLQHYADACKISGALHFLIISGDTFENTKTLMIDAGFPEPQDITTFPELPKVTPNNKTATYSKTTGYKFYHSAFEPTSDEIDLTVANLFSPIFDSKVKRYYNGHTWLVEREIAEVWRAKLFDAVSYPLPVGFKVSQLDTKKLQKVLTANKWQPATWETIVEIAPADKLKECLRAYRLGYYINATMPQTMQTFLNFARRFQSRTQFVTTFVPKLHTAAQNEKFYQPYSAALEPFISIDPMQLDNGICWPNLELLAAQPSVVPVMQQVEREIDLYVKALEKMVADHPLLWHIALAASDLPMGDLLAYLKRND